MVVAVNKNRKRSSASKPPENRKGRALIIVVIGALVLGFLAFVIWLWAAKTPKAPAPKPQQKQEQPRPQKPVNTYSYTEILEHKKIDSGSGVTITRNYEAERQAKEAEYYRKIAERKKRIQEERERQQAEKELRLEKQRLEKERIRLEKEKARLEKERKAQEASAAKEAASAGNSSSAGSGASPATLTDSSGIMMVTKSGDKQIVINDKRQKGKTYLYCQENYRTSRDAESLKARMALEGNSSIIYRKKMGGGYVYSLIVGPVSGDKNALKTAVQKSYNIVCN
jgi:cell division protein FtsN